MCVRIKGDELRGEEEQLLLLHHLSFSQTSTHLLAHPSARFVSIILDNLWYNLICFLLKCTHNISLDDECDGEGGEIRCGGGWRKNREKQEVRKEREAVAPFMWDSMVLIFMAVGGSDQVPDNNWK